jgi:DNA-binding NarL/FixJ family response regulator
MQEIWLDRSAVRALVAGATAEGIEGRRIPGPLSSRQRAVLSGLFEGLTNKEIAGKLQISENAVKWVLQQLFEKTGARVRSQLVRIILERYGKDWMTAPSAGQERGGSNLTGRQHE